VTRFLAHRLLLLALTLLLVATFTFLLTYVVPSDPARILAGDRGGIRDIEQIRAELGLDDPIWVQYGRYLWNVVHLDLGYSYSRRAPVFDVVSARLPWTAVLAVAAMVVSLGIGVPIGLITAARAGAGADRLSLVLGLIVLSMPQFFLSLVLLYFLAFKWPVFPLGGAESPASIVLPAIALGLPGAAWYSRVMRSATLEILGADFMRALRAKGTPRRALLYKHALRAAFSPVLTMMALDFGFFLGGAVFVETVFSWPGLGLTTYQALTTGDTALVMGCVLVGALFVLVMNLVADVARAFVDPRVRLERGPQPGPDDDGARLRRLPGRRRLRRERVLVAPASPHDVSRAQDRRYGGARDELRPGRSDVRSGPELGRRRRESLPRSSGAASPATPLLEVENLVVSFKSGAEPIVAVDGVSFTLEPGARFALVGESGSGKSTTALSILGLIDPPGTMSADRIALRGHDLSSLSEAHLRRVRGREVGLIMQDPLASLSPVFSVGEQIAETIRYHERVGRRESMRRAVILLESVGIPNAGSRARDYPHQLSGGMRQRVAIAIALACEPALLIADEPTTALDVTIQAQILELLSALASERGMAVLIISHDLGLVAGFADEIAVMYAGRIVECGHVDSIYYSPRHPYTRALLECQPRVDAPRSKRLVAIQGMPPSLVQRPSGCQFHPRCSHRHGRARCSQTVPLLQAIEDSDHLSACHFAAELDGSNPPARAPRDE
jgi:peptide/nickel transport system ATP-binding protein